MRLDVREFGTRRAAERMARMSAGLEDPRPALEDVSDMLADIGERRFRTGGDGDWDALRRSTVERKRRSGGGSKIGHDTGKLARSLSQPRGRGTSRRIAARSGRMVWRTTVPYAGWGPRRGNRDWFELNRKDRRRIGRRLQRWLIRGR
jgi:hypothetical protein